MKRLLRYTVASVTAFGLLISNCPLTEFIVRADEQTSAENYTFTYDEESGDCSGLKSGSQAVAENEYLYPGSTITLEVSNGSDSIDTDLEINLMDGSAHVTLHEGESYIVNHLVQYRGFFNPANNGGEPPVPGDQGGEAPAGGDQGGEAPAGGDQGGEVPAGDQGGEVPSGGDQGGEVPAGDQGGEAPAAGDQGGEAPAGGDQGGEAPAGGDQGGEAPAGGDQGGEAPGGNNNSQVNWVIDLNPVTRVEVSSNIWCEFFVICNVNVEDHVEERTEQGSVRYAMKHNEFVADDFSDSTVVYCEGTINRFHLQPFHTPEGFNSGDGEEEYENFRFKYVEVNGAKVTQVIDNQTVPKIFSYAEIDYFAADLSGNSFDPEDDGLITIKVVGDNAHAARIEWADSIVPDDHIQGNLIAEHCVFDHGSAEILSVLDGSGNDISWLYDLAHCKDEWGNGGITVESGYKIVFKLIPERGYQLDTVCENGFPEYVPTTSADDADANIYVFDVHDNCVHFSSQFILEPDELKVEGGPVVQGNIELSETVIDSGSGLATVTELTNAEKNSYANTDWDNDIEVQEYLSIDLDNRFKIANTNDYWKDALHDDLNGGNVWVALDLGEDFDPGDENVQIIHIPEDANGNKGEPEYLDTTYDAETHTVFFNTTGFSDFMVGTTANDVSEANVPEGFTAEPKQNTQEPGNDPPRPENGNGEREVPCYDVVVIDGEVLIGTKEGEDFAPVEPGQAIPGDAVISNRLPDDLSPDFELIYYVDGEKVMVSNLEEREEFIPGHFVTVEDIKNGVNSIEIYFAQCWVIGIDVTEIDISMTVLDKNGKEVKPLSTPDGIKYPAFECGKADPEDYTYYEISYGECPYEVVIKGINGYAIFWLAGDYEECLTTPIGANSIKYPDKHDYLKIDAWGMIPETETMNFTESLTSASAVFVGLSEDEIDDYLLVVSEIDMDDAPKDIVSAAKSQVADEGYTGVVFPMAFDITLFDKDGAVHDPGFPVRITLVLKEELDLEDGETVVILHIIDEDKFELIEAIYNAKNLTLTFETDTFSPFVVTTGTKTAAAVVSTGEAIDSTRVVIASLMIAAAAATGLYLIRKKEEYSEENDPTI